MKRKMLSIGLLMIVIFAIVLTGCGSPTGEGASGNSQDGSNSDNSESYTFQVGHVVTTDHSYHLGLLKFGELLDQKTDGRVKLEIFPSAQLGNERDLVEGLTMGTVDMTLAASGNLATFIDTYQVFDLPFLFRDNEHAHKVLDGEIGQEAMASLDAIGIKGLGNWENGFYCTWNSKRPIEHPEDIKGLKIRANDNPIHISSYDALDVSAITMGWSEVYTAIQNGTVDGVAVSIPSMYTAKMYEVAPYISTSSEFYVTAVLMMNEDLYNSLPEDIQKALTEAASEAGTYQREVNGQIKADALKALEEEGFEITHPENAEWKEACWQQVYDEYADKLGADRINSILEDY